MYFLRKGKTTITGNKNFLLRNRNTTTWKKNDFTMDCWGANFLSEMIKISFILFNLQANMLYVLLILTPPPSKKKCSIVSLFSLWVVIPHPPFLTCRKQTILISLILKFVLLVVERGWGVGCAKINTFFQYWIFLLSYVPYMTQKYTTKNYKSVSQLLLLELGFIIWIFEIHGL